MGRWKVISRLSDGTLRQISRPSYESARIEWLRTMRVNRPLWCALVRERTYAGN